MSCCALALASAIAFGQDREGPYSRARTLVSQTQNDLQQSETNPASKHEDRERYDNAARHLSTFDKNLLKHHFDKGQLNDAIGDGQSVLDHNTLTPESRDALMRDLGDLRRLRADYDTWHE